MSTYYSFYLGYTTKDGKLHAYGPFDKFNNIRPMLEKSRSFISDLYQDFIKVPIDKMDDYLYQHFTYKNPYKENERCAYLYYLPADELPGTDYIKRGYFTAEDITDYLTTGEPYFSDYYNETEYSLKLSTAVKNDDKEEIDRLKKYTYFSYPEYECKEYESYVMHQFMSYNGPFDRYHMESTLKENGEELDKVIILLTIN